MFFEKAVKTAVFCCVMIFCACMTSVAADSGTLKIGVMNVQKVLIQSESGLKARTIFENKKKEIEDSLSADNKAMQDLQQEIEKMSSVWSKEKKDEKVLAFNKMRRDLQTKTEDGRMEMKRLQDKELEPILKTLETVVDEFGAKNKYTVILDSKNGVIFYDKATDVSDALIEALNKAMKK